MIEEIISCFETPIQVRRINQATVFVKGRAQVETDIDTFCVQRASVQPMKGRERQVLPELIRDKELLKIYTACELRSDNIAGKVKADRIDYNDEGYVVHSVEDWTGHGEFYKVIVVKEDDD